MAKTIPSVLGLLGWLALTFVAAGIGAMFPPGDWYAGLTKPAWNPPNWLFGPVWTALYVMMAFAAWFIWKRYGLAGALFPLLVFVIQMVLNAAWSWLFFGLQRPGIAFAEILVLWLAILVTTILFFRLHGVAGLLLIPYLLWVTFAAVLNFTIWRLNS